MIWLGLAVSLAFIPGILGATIPTGWAVLSAFLPLALWRKGSVSLLHLALFLSWCWAVVSFAWGSSIYSSVWGLWMFTMFCLAFWLGSTIQLRGLLIGLSVGAWVSSMVAIGQSMNLNYVLVHNFSVPSGLHFNPIAQGMFIALLIVALVGHRMWAYIPFVAPGLLLSQSRGAYAACALGILATYVRKPMLLLILCLAGAVYATHRLNMNDSERLAIWHGALTYLTPLGNGIGSFMDFFIQIGGRLRHPEYTHNDFLQLAFELGIGAIPVALVFAGLASRTGHREWPLLISFLFLACVAFPSYLPLTALLGAVAAGRIAGDWHSLRLPLNAGRYGLLPCLPRERQGFSETRS